MSRNEGSGLALVRCGCRILRPRDIEIEQGVGIGDGKWECRSHVRLRRRQEKGGSHFERRVERGAWQVSNRSLLPVLQK